MLENVKNLLSDGVTALGGILILKEEVGHRKFFDPERQANDAARNDAQVFNNILNDKVKEGVSNIRRNRYLTYSVTADTAEDAARQLSRIEVESSRILNSIGRARDCRPCGTQLSHGTRRVSRGMVPAQRPLFGKPSRTPLHCRCA